MKRANTISWMDILYKEAAYIEKHFRVAIYLDEAITLEIARLVKDNLAATGLIDPNVAKIAGQVAFWVRKLKPLSIAPNSPNKLLTVNELASLHVGIAICNLYMPEKKIKLPPHILRDWVNSFRYHAHSPHSSMITFEILLCDM